MAVDDDLKNLREIVESDGTLELHNNRVSMLHLIN